MPQVTQQQLASNGWSLVMGSGQRIQVWTGAVQGESRMILWDSVTGRQKVIPQGPGSELQILRVAMAVLGVLADLIAAAPFLTAGQRAAANAVLLDALAED